MAWAMAQCLLLIVGTGAAPAFAGERPSWQVAVVIDQSGSTRSTDPNRNALLATSILADLLGTRDRLTVYPQYGIGSTLTGGSGSGPDLVLDPTRRSDLRAALAGLDGTASGSDFHASLDRAIAELDRRASLFDRQLLIHLYDGDRAASDPVALENRLNTLAGRGAHRHLIKMGTSGSLLHAYGPDHTSIVSTSGDLLDAYALAMGRLLNTEQVPRATAGPRHTFTMPSAVSEAWLVALADAPVQALVAQPGHPPATRVVPVADGGWNITTHRNTTRGYAILHLTDPSPGQWTVQTTTGASTVEYLLLPYFDVGVKVRVTNSPVAGGDAGVEVEIEGDLPPSEVEVEATIGGRTVMLTRQPDGRWAGDIPVAIPGLQTVEVVARGGGASARTSTEITVEKSGGTFDCSGFDGQTVALGTEVVIETIPTGTGPAPIDRAWLDVDGRRVTLADDGVLPDRSAGDGTFSGSFTPSDPGVLQVTAINERRGVQRACSGRLDVRHVVQLQAVPVDLGEVGPCGGSADPTDPAPEDCDAAGCCTGRSFDLDLSATAATGSWTAELSLVDPLPSGVEVHVADQPGREGVLSVGHPVSVPLPQSSPTVPMRVCITACPTSGTFAPLARIAVKAPDAYTPEPAGTLVLDGPGLVVPVSAIVLPSAFWLCWGKWVVTALIVGTLLFLLWGLIRPLRFPRPDVDPYNLIPSTVSRRMGRPQQVGPRRALRMAAPAPQVRMLPTSLHERRRWRFLLHERAAVDASGEAQAWSADAPVLLQLERGPEGVGCRLTAPGAKACIARYKKHLEPDQYERHGTTWKEVPEEGVLVRPGDAVWLQGLPNDPLIVFSHDPA